MEKMQEFIDFIFYEVWCKAPDNGAFRLELFDGNADLKEVMTSFFYDHTASGDFIYGHVERIYGHFAALSDPQINQIKVWYQANNDIERACANDPAVHIAKYAAIMPVYQALGEQLAQFFKGLYDNIDVAALRQKIGDIDDHYRHFMQANDLGKCPFCGIGDVKGVHHTKREAYDHYLPKALYPFNSINFRNLAPACHECNSTYKLGKDPLNSPAGRRRAFYPYANVAHSIDIKVELVKSDVDKLTRADVRLEFGPAVLMEQIETWKEVYGIEERYKAKCCGKSDGKYWLAQVLDEWQEDGRSPADFLLALARQANKNPYADSNFLKKAFLDGCDRIGILGNTDNAA